MIPEGFILLRRILEEDAELNDNSQQGMIRRELVRFYDKDKLKIRFTHNCNS